MCACASTNFVVKTNMVYFTLHYGKKQKNHLDADFNINYFLNPLCVFDACSHVTCKKNDKNRRFSIHSVMSLFVIQKTQPASI